MKKKTTKQIFLIAIGCVSLFFGAIGLVLPILPTTPFLLLSAGCFLRSSVRLHDWLMNHPLFGEHLRLYIQYKAVRKRAKIGALVFLWLSLGLSILLVEILWLRILLACIGTVVSWHILSLKTFPKDACIGKEALPKEKHESI